jgi:glycosyltransferase involved in cell wall biosynthesis
VVVVTDRYPPFTSGGAELSLHITLCEIARSRRVTVIVLGAEQESAREKIRDGMSVIYLPRSGPWPFHRWTRAKFNRIEAGPDLARNVAFVAGCFGFLFGGSLNGLAHRASALAIWLLNGTKLVAATDLLAAPNHMGIELAALIGRLKPRLIHADNHDAICAVAGRQDIPVVGFVRDNRFLCARQDQSATIGEKTCQHCTVACIEGGSVSARFNRMLIRQTVAHRRNCLGSMTRVVAASGYLTRQLANIVPADLVRQVVNPVDPPSFPQAVSDRTDGQVHIAVIGSLTEKKGQLALLRHFPEMQARIPDLHLHFIGSGPDKAALAAIVEAQRAASNVTLHGNLSRQALYGMLASCQIVAIPSLWAEPFGRVAIEAAAMALPAVAFAVGGLKERIRPGVTGLLVPPAGFTQFIDALALLAAKPELRKKLGAAAREAVMELHAPAAVAGQLVRVWDEAMAAFAAGRS